MPAIGQRRRAECRRGVDFFRQFDASVAALRDVTPDLLEAHQSGLPENVQKHRTLSKNTILQTNVFIS